MLLEKIKNAKRNIFFGFLNKLIVLFYPFIIRIFVIQEFGAEVLGLTSLFNSILQVLNLAELGFSTVVVFSMYKPIAEDDNETLCAILNFYRKIYFAVGMTILIMGMILLPFIPKLINGAIPDEVNIYSLYLIYLINTVVSYLLFAYKTSLLNAYQRTDVISNINSVIFIFTYTFQLILVLYAKNFYLYALCLLASTICINIFTAFITKRMFPQIICTGKISIVQKKVISEKIKGVLISKIGGISRNALDSIFLSLFLGLLETAIYNNYYLIMMTVTGFLLVIYSALQGGIGNAISTETQKKNHEDLYKINFLYMWISGWASICLLCLYQPFSALFFGCDMLFPMHIVILFCLYFYILKIGDILSLYSEANGLWWKMRYVVYIEIILNIFLNYFLGKKLGVSGIVAESVISILCVNFLSVFYVFKNYFTDYKPISYIFAHGLYFLITVFNAIICFFICGQIAIHNFVGFILKVIICFSVPNIIYFVIYRNTKVYKNALPLFLSIVHLQKQ